MFLLVWLAATAQVDAQPVTLVKDINPSGDSWPEYYAATTTHVFFAADDGTRGVELWKSDGTATGTVLVKDISPGSSSPRWLVNVNGTVFFVADDSVTGRELWKTDGTAAGTMLVKDIYPGITGALDPALPQTNESSLTAVGGVLMFAAVDGTGVQGLWKTNGTAAGTVLVRYLNGGGGFTNVNGTLFFRNYDPASGYELWKSDGTTAGTVMVKDINPGSGTSINYPGNCSFCGLAPYAAAVNGVLFFVADDGTSGDELWRSDGTAAGTFQVKDIFPGPTGSSPGQLTVVGSTLFFTADNGPNGRELWKSDGTDLGTVMVKEMVPGTSGPELFELTASGGRLFFGSASDPQPGRLWVTDGTAAGTQVLYNGNFSYLADASGTLLFNCGPQFCQSDGTPAGTAAIGSTRILNRPGSAPLRLASSGPGFFYTGNTPSYAELYLYSSSLLPVSLSVNDVTVGEGDSGTRSAIFTVSLSKAAGQAVTVSYSTRDQSARAGSDYTAVSGTLTFPPGMLTQTISVQVTGDAAPEPDETLVVSISAPSNATIAIGQGMGTIADDDGQAGGVRITIDDRAVLEGSAINAAFTVSLSAASSQDVSVGYATADGTALAGSDYTVATGTLLLTPGRTKHSIAVPVTSDVVAEGSESFYLNLLGASGATILRGQAVGTIGDQPSAQHATMYRSYNKSTDYHFFTTDLASKNFAVSVLGFQDESNPPPFYVSNVLLSGTVPLFRIYNPNLGRHFYTASTGSRDFLMGIGAVYEKEEGFVYPLSTSPQPSGTTELFLLYNNNSGTHLFTADAAAKDGILNLFKGVWVQHTSVGFVFTSP